MKPKPIRDPIFNYIETTPLEQAIIDTPHFQRLRFIYQNSSAFLTYPSNVTNRFVHSLGVMHLSGQIFEAAIKNAESKHLSDYLNEGFRYLKRKAQIFATDIEQFIKEAGILKGNGGCFCHAHLDKEQEFTLQTLWQVVRICGAVHDIGHLPLSHIYEIALEEMCSEFSVNPDSKEAELSKEKNLFIKNFISDFESEELKEEFKNNAGAFHEILGQKFIKDFCPTDIQNISSYPKLVYHIIQNVLLVQGRPRPDLSEDHFLLLRPLHSIYSGHIDADRLDYCLRDPRSSGLEHGAFDIQRLISNFKLVKKKNHYYVVPTVKAMSAIDSFYHQRYLIYKYLIYHHNVVRMDQVAKEIIKRLYRIALNKNMSSHWKDFFKTFSLWDYEAEEGDKLLSIDSLKYMTEGWLRTLMTETSKKIPSVLQDKDLDSNESILLMKTKLLIETFIDRKSNNLFSLWKSEADYKNTVHSICNDLGFDEGQTRNAFQVMSLQYKIPGKIMKKLLDSFRHDLYKKGVILLNRDLKPKLVDEIKVKWNHEDGKIEIYKDSHQIAVDGHLESLTDHSFYLTSMLAMLSHSQTLHLSFLAENIKDDKETQQYCRGETLKMLRHFLERFHGTEVAINFPGGIY